MRTVRELSLLQLAIYVSAIDFVLRLQTTIGNLEEGPVNLMSNIAMPMPDLSSSRRGMDVSESVG